MKKFVTSLLAMVMLLSLCTGCGGQKDSSSTGDTASAGTPSAETVVLRLANSHNAEHITSQACQMFADLVNEKTDGRITIECHFAGELGDERSTIEQCQFGGLDFTRVSSGASAEFAPLMNALQMPYEYTSVDHLFEFWTARSVRKSLRPSRTTTWWVSPICIPVPETSSTPRRRSTPPPIWPA